MTMKRPAELSCHLDGLRPTATETRPILITGGAGFIGSNLAAALLREGRRVRLLDNLSRPGVRENLEWLRKQHPDRVEVLVEDVRNTAAVLKAVDNCAAVFHFAAQVAVTTSLCDPMSDFEINLGGTLRLLEALRRLNDPPPLIFTSTNKVYGDLDEWTLEESNSRYVPVGTASCSGVNESQPLNFRSAYGCSKGAADQYVLDYAKSFGLATVVFRMSCVYGPHQRGSEDQGWVCHIARRIAQGQPVVIYGDGKQVRDLLFIDDLVNAFTLALAKISNIAGHTFNIGGGTPNAISVLELIDLVAELSGSRPKLRYAGWRTGDQKYYVSDISKFTAATAWCPLIGVRSGVTQLYRWILGNCGDVPITSSVQLNG